MRRWWLILLIAVPVLEIWGIAQMSNWIGGWMTLWLLIAMAALGIYLIRIHGSKSWKEIMQQYASGRPPGHAILNAFCIIAGSVLLIIPGFFSDIIALILLLPFTRPIFKGFMLLWLERLLRSGTMRFIRRR